MKARHLTLTILILLFSLAPLQAQDEPAAGFDESLDVTEVLLDVLVTDKDGRVILGLTADDFQVTEGGKAADLTSAVFYSNRPFRGPDETAEEAGITADERPSDRYFVLFFHDQTQAASALTSRQLDAGRRTRAWIKTGLSSNDQVAVVSYDVKLKIHQDFTHDQSALLKAVDNAIKRVDPGDNWPSRPNRSDGATLLTGLPQGKDLGKETRRFEDAMVVLAEALGGFVGRKNIIMFSTGFGDVDDLGLYRPDPLFYPPMMEALNSHNVAVYAIDLIPTSRGGGARGRTLNNSLSVLATDTGGNYYINFTSFEAPLTKIAEDNGGYYLLSYTSRHPAGTSGYQNVDVKAKNPEFRVRARRGYLYGE